MKHVAEHYRIQYSQQTVKNKNLLEYFSGERWEKR